MENIISVIVPTYNAEKTIEETIKSIVGENIEIIIVIDGSTDKTLKICKKMQKEKGNIKIIEQENKGPFEARLTGINHAEGKYIMFIDSDDKYTENTIKRINEIIKKYNEPDLIRFRYERIPDGIEQARYCEENERYIIKENFQKDVYPRFLKSYMLNAMWSNCIKKDILKKLNIQTSSVKYGEDLLMNLEIFTSIDNVVFINDVLYKYYRQEDSLTSTKSIEKLFKNLESAIEVYSTLNVYLKRWNMDTEENIKMVNDIVKKESVYVINIINLFLNNEQNN